MLFIAILIAAASAIAGSAAYFSVYGLANTFSGVFWSVVVMGASLEAGKLVAASYLYRYWDKIHITLKSYLLAGVAALMLLTSSGIFGYLSSGYQQDILPLKQKNDQLQLLTEERERTLARKKQIDDLLAGGPVVNTQKSDAGTARVLREATRAKESSARQYRDEQTAVTKRLSELDTQLLELRQELVKTEAHIGPITYIAKAFGMPTDDATKYLIFLIVFAFDPMAVALTLCVNIALKLQEEDKVDEVKQDPVPEKELSVLLEPPRYDFSELTPLKPAQEPEPVKYDFSDLKLFTPSEEIEEEVVSEAEVKPDPQPEPAVNTPEPQVQQPAPTLIEDVPRVRRTRVYPGMWSGTLPAEDKIKELVGHYRMLKAKADVGQQLTQDELWEKHQIEQVLRRHNLDIYL